MQLVDQLTWYKVGNGDADERQRHASMTSDQQHLLPQGLAYDWRCYRVLSKHSLCMYGSSLHGRNLAIEMLMRDTAMPAWLVTSSTRRPSLSIKYAATPVPATLTHPTMMLPKIGERRPALVKTCMLMVVKICR